MKSSLVPAKAETQGNNRWLWIIALDSRLRGNERSLYRHKHKLF